MVFLSPIDTGVGVGIYDEITKAVVLQYQKMPNSNPYDKNTLLQVTSSDDGVTWSAPRDLTAMLRTCYPPSPDPVGNMVCGGAGSRIQLKYGPHKGRLIFAGHNTNGVCVWFSDDHGQTYQTTTGGLIKGNEISIAQLADGNGTLYMNGRGTEIKPGKRASYTSTDSGLTWTKGEPVPDLDDVNCEAAVVATYAKSPTTGATDTTLFFSEPHGPGRISYRLYCSRDGGSTWPSYIEVNTGAAAEYSALLELPSGEILAVWELAHYATQASYAFNTSWCK
jgi:sialidase-1